MEKGRTGKYRFWNSSKQSQSYIKTASADQLKVNYSKADVHRWKNLDNMIKKKYVIGTVTSMGLLKVASFQASCQ